MVRFLQTLRGTIRKIEHQTTILEQSWASYFNAYPYRQQLRRYADLDRQVSNLKLKWKWSAYPPKFSFNFLPKERLDLICLLSSYNPFFFEPWSYFS